MSNHESSYLLNNVLLAAQKAGLFKTTSKKQKRAFLNEVIQIAFDYDCNPGEILQDLGEEFQTCYYCLNESKKLTDGLCPECYG
jgi:hypothetical protein